MTEKDLFATPALPPANLAVVALMTARRLTFAVWTNGLARPPDLFQIFDGLLVSLEGLEEFDDVHYQCIKHHKPQFVKSKSDLFRNNPDDYEQAQGAIGSVELQSSQSSFSWVSSRFHISLPSQPPPFKQVSRQIVTRFEIGVRRANSRCDREDRAKLAPTATVISGGQRGQVFDHSIGRGRRLFQPADREFGRRGRGASPGPLLDRSSAVLMRSACVSRTSRLA